MTRTPWVWGASLVALLSCGRVELLEDFSLDLWCGEGDLCAWEVEEGQVERVGTWHRSDPAARLEGPRVVLSQPVPRGAWPPGACVTFSFVADVDPGVDLSFELDFFDDGSAQVALPILVDDFERIAHPLLLPEAQRRLTVRLRKEGPGSAVIAQIRGQIVDDGGCEGPRVDPYVHAQIGHACQHDGHCTEGSCGFVQPVGLAALSSAHTCGWCGSDADCATGEVCGLQWADEAGAAHRACVPGASKRVGTNCVIDGECATGTCREGLCAQCVVDEDCAETCDLRSFAQSSLTFAVCDDGAGRGAAGAPCLDDGQCASGSCVGSGRYALCPLDARPCAQCASACDEVGVIDGRCE